MTFLHKLSVALGTLLALLTSASALDREAFTFTRYDLNVRIEPEQHRLGARGRITLRNDSSQPQHIAALQISSTLNWRSIRAVAEPSTKSGEESKLIPLQFVTQPFASDIDHTSDLSEAIVTLPHEVAPKQSVTLEIGYEGVILLDATRLTRIGTPGAVARHNDWDQIGESFAALRGIGYVAWYPVAMEAQSLSDGDAMFVALGKWKARHAESTMNLQVELVASATEAPFVVQTNGKDCLEQAESTGGASEFTLTCTFDSLGFAEPTLVAGRLREENSKTLRLRYLPEHATEAAEFVKTAEGVAPLVQDWFGTPKVKAEVVELADPDAAPFEAGDMLLLPITKGDPKLVQLLQTHQLTHAAFSSSRLWIREGAAHFTQALARERQNGREGAVDYMERHRAAVLQVEKAGGTTGGEPLETATNEVFYRSKAALVWWMLRDMLGDATLKKAIRAYDPAADHDPTYFQHVLEEQSKRDLTWFFHDWVYTDAGLPDFRLESANARQGTGSNFVTAVTIENTGTAGAEVTVTIRTNNGDFTQRLEMRAKSKAVTRIATPAEPIEIVVNDGSVPESDVRNNRLTIAKNAPPK